MKALLLVVIATIIVSAAVNAENILHNNSNDKMTQVAKDFVVSLYTNLNTEAKNTVLTKYGFSGPWNWLKCKICEIAMGTFVGAVAK